MKIRIIKICKIMIFTVNKLRLAILFYNAKHTSVNLRDAVENIRKPLIKLSGPNYNKISKKCI